MSRNKLLFLLILSFLVGLWIALLQNVWHDDQEAGDVYTGKEHPEGVSRSVKDSESTSGSEEESGMPDLSGLAQGQGEVLFEIPPGGSDGKEWQEMSTESSVGTKNDDVFWPDFDGKTEAIEEQINEIRDDINRVTLEAVDYSLNSIPFVSADPDSVHWHVSGSEVKLEIKIPAEDISIGPKDWK